MSSIASRIATVHAAVQDLAGVYMLGDLTITFDGRQTIMIGETEIAVSNQSGRTCIYAYLGDDKTFHTVTTDWQDERQAAATVLDWIKRHRIATAADDFAADCGRAAEESVASPTGGFTPAALLARDEWIIGGVIESMPVPEVTRGATMNQAYYAGVAAGYRAAARMDSAELILTVERVRQGALGVGGWTDGRGVLVLDVCDTARGEGLARRKATSRGEEAIWHPTHGERTI